MAKMKSGIFYKEFAKFSEGSRGAIQKPLAASLVAELRNTIKVLYPTERVLLHVCNLNQVCVVFHYFDKKVSATCCYMSSTKKGQ